MDSSTTTGKRQREANDEGDQDLHRDNDIDMNNLVISECLANEDFLVELVPGLESLTPEDHLEDSAIVRSKLRDNVL